MKQKNNLKLDQSYERNSIRIDSDSRTKNDIDNYFNNTDTLNTYANKNKSQKHKKYRNSPDRGPYADFSENELYELTETVLSPSSSSPEQRTTSTPTLSTNLKMTRQELHEATRLMSSWTKRKVEKSGVLAERLLNRVIDEKVGGNEDVNLTPIMFHMVSRLNKTCFVPRNLTLRNFFKDMKNLYYVGIVRILCSFKYESFLAPSNEKTHPILKTTFLQS